MPISTTMTELEAVNLILRNDGESPVTTLVNSGFGEAADALTVLRQTSRAIQTAGWTFNTDYEMKFVPDTEGVIILPSNTLWHRTAGSDRGCTYTLRAGKLYDPNKNTHVFTEPVYLDVCTGLSFEDLTEPARAYIAIVAARKFQQESTGSPAQDSLTGDDEFRAKVALERAEGRIHRRKSGNSAAERAGLRRGIL